MIGAIGDHDRRTRGHSERARLYADLLGESCTTSDDRQSCSGRVHDLGKLMVPGENQQAGRPDPPSGR
jgi:HD-GYP domain-containing protein (c-di-GMP phosphodiesterase class II)